MYRAISKSYLYFLVTTFIAFSATAISAQSSENLDDLQRQLKQLKSKITDLQSANDPFGDRVRSVGRQRVVKPEPLEDELVIRFYDLSDVFSVAPQYPAQTPDDFHSHISPLFPIAAGRATRRTMSASGGFGGGGGGVFNFPPAAIGSNEQQQSQPASVQASRVSMSSLVSAVKQTVSPEDWDDTNGDASVSILGNTLLISATEQMHEQIADLINLFRDHWGKLKTVAIEAYWITATPDEISDLLETDLENPVVGTVNKKKWSKFFPKANEEKRIPYSGSMCGQNGQTLHTVSGRRHFVVMDADPIYSFSGKRQALEDEDVDLIDQSIAGLKPVRSVFHEGAALQASPLATRGGNFVILDLHTRVNKYVDSDANEATKFAIQGKQEQTISVDLENRPYISYRLSTTVRCSNGSVVLAGGMTYDANNAADHSNLYLFVKTDIHTIEEDRAGGESEK